jgi:hypothetical protein
VKERGPHSVSIDVGDEPREYWSVHPLHVGAGYTLNDESGTWLVERKPDTDEWKALPIDNVYLGELGPLLTRKL